MNAGASARRRRQKPLGTPSAGANDDALVERRKYTARRFIAAYHPSELAARLGHRRAEQAVKPGNQVKLVAVSDDYPGFNLTVGQHGPAESTDSLGTVHVRWCLIRQTDGSS